MSRLGDLLALTVALALLACGGGEGAAPSAGDGSSPGDAGPVRTLYEEPDFSVAEGRDPAFQLFRVAHGVILEDGTAVVANVSARQLIYFDSTGRATRVAGGPGQGPGELGSVNGLFLTEDGVGASETGSRRVSFFSASGDFTGTLTLQGAAVSTVAGVAAGGGLVTALFRSPPGERRLYQVWNERGEVIRELHGPAEPPLPYMLYPGAPSPIPDRPPGTVNRLLDAGCFAGSDQAVLGTDVYAVDPGAGMVVAFDASGAAREIYRDPHQATFTEALRDALRTRLAIGNPPPPADTIEAVLARLAPVGAPLPSWNGLLVDPSGSGRLWLRRAVCPTAAGPRSYDVIDGGGAHLGTVTIPGGLTVLAVRGERVLVVRRDELGVERLELYRLRPWSVVGATMRALAPSGYDDAAPSNGAVAPFMGGCRHGDTNRRHTHPLLVRLGA